MTKVAMMTNLLRCIRNGEPLLMLNFAGLTSGKAEFVLYRNLVCDEFKESICGQICQNRKTQVIQTVETEKLWREIIENEGIFVISQTGVRPLFILR